MFQCEWPMLVSVVQGSYRKVISYAHHFVFLLAKEIAILFNPHKHWVIVHALIPPDMYCKYLPRKSRQQVTSPFYMYSCIVLFVCIRIYLRRQERCWYTTTLGSFVAGARAGRRRPETMESWARSATYARMISASLA